MLADLIYDLRFALRQLRSAPTFTATVVLTLALSVGVATAVFCVIDTVILRPLPYAQQDKIVAIQTNSRAGGYTQPASWPSFQDERREARSFDALAAYWDNDKVVLQIPDGNSVVLPSVGGTDNFFRVFGVQPLLGRTYLPGEEQPGKNDVAVLSYEVWQSQFNGDPGIVNRAIHMNGKPFVVIGVMPAGFRFPLNVRNAVYTPLHVDQMWMQHRGTHWLRTAARIKDGVSLAQAQADLTRVLGQLGKTYPSTDDGRTVHLLPLADSVNSKSKGPLWTLLAAVLAVLAIGCVNVAGLLLALAFLADFFGAAALDFLADFFADFLADFFEAFFEAFLADFFFAVRTFFFLSFLPFLLFFPLAIVILLVAADQCPSGVSS